LCGPRGSLPGVKHGGHGFKTARGGSFIFQIFDDVERRLLSLSSDGKWSNRFLVLSSCSY
jgi:hypothetical protein